MAKLSTLQDNFAIYDTNKWLTISNYVDVSNNKLRLEYYESGVSYVRSSVETYDIVSSHAHFMLELPDIAYVISTIPD